ncbi:hypothetical protein GCM10023340_36610 [Nocardioides marinquilinus]|uniref:Uncharacterized protein n=1 Tax=Nocardioides marinquilinus TaxID=1210400 RepID=A0ABP9Q0M3_9ACTN
MTRIVIDDVDGPEDLLRALAAVQTAFASGRADYAARQEYFSRPSDGPGGPGGRDGPVPPLSRLRPGEVRAIVPDLPSPARFAPCPRRGAHVRLEDCWSCWSDVRRGACAAVDVLAPEAWDVALRALTSSGDSPLEGSDGLDSPDGPDGPPGS